MPGRSFHSLALACAAVCLIGASGVELETAQRPPNLSLVGVDEHRTSTPRDKFELVRVMGDPIEGFNRGSLGFTKAIVDWGLHPLARGWRFLTPHFVRKGVENFAYNLGFPGRFVSLLLQGELVDTGQETGHFLVNTTVGIAGFLDVADPLGIPTHRADVGLSFARWGFGPGFYFVIPLLGPSTGRDAIGRIFDTALAPTTYVPGVGWLFTINGFADRLPTYDALSQTDLDFYSLVRTIWGLRRHIDATRYRIPDSAYANSDPEPSLGVLAFRVQGPDFPGLVREVSVVSPRTQRAVPFALWLQPGNAPIVYLIPGIGAQRRSTNPVALAELAYKNGYSVAVVSSPFHPEFIATGLSSLYPGYTPEDAADLYAVISALDAELRKNEPGMLAGARLLGYSLGAIESLHIAALDRAAGPGALHFERVMAINPPVELAYSARGFDHYFDAPLRWPEGERRQRVIELAMKAFLVAQEGLPPGKPLPLDRTESEFVIGLSGHATIVQALEAIQRRGGGELVIPPGADETQGALFAKVNAGSLANYAEQLAVPYFVNARHEDREALMRAANLKSLEAELRGDERIRAMTNANDFILGPENLAWLQGALGDRLTVFPEGGHLGNLFVPEVQRVVVDGLGARPGSARP